MFGWLWKLLGYHVCEDFTRWERIQEEWENHLRFRPEAPPMRYTKIYQRRQCKECGRIYELPLGAD